MNRDNIVKSMHSKTGTRTVSGIGKIAAMLAVIGCQLASGAGPLTKVLVFTTAAGYVHPSIPICLDTIKNIGKRDNFQVVEAAAPNAFTLDNLKQYQVVVFDNNTQLGATGGLVASQQQAFWDYLSAGGSYVGIHAAGDQKGTINAYSDWLGGMLTSHGSGNPLATVDVDPASSQSPIYGSIMQGLAAKISFSEEWYSFDRDPSITVKKDTNHVIYTLDETSVSNKTQLGPLMGYHPAAWARNLPGGGRMFYTAVGHRPDVYQNPWFVKQLENAIKWAAGGTVHTIRQVEAKPGDYGTSLQSKTASFLEIAFHEPGEHTAEILNLDGKRVAYQRGIGIQTHVFGGLRSNNVYVVVTSSKIEGRRSQLVTIR